MEIGAIKVSISEPNEFISNIFIVPKPGGKFRPVINLKALNEFVTYHHFKQETFNVVLDLLQENDFMTSVDMEQAYYSIPIHKESQKYLKFYWNEVLYSFSCLPFGLASAPYIFTKILKPVYSYFRQLGIRCSYYIDDSLNMNLNQAVCKANTLTMIDTLQKLGYTINHSKSVLIPTQRMVFFGFIIDSVQFMVFLTEEKLQKIILYARNIYSKNTIIVRELASFIGLIINAFYAVFEAPLHYRTLERNKILGLNSSTDFNQKMILSDESKMELLWWIENIRLKNGKRIRPFSIQSRCRTDASKQGWGCEELDTERYSNGRWNPEESALSINYLELLAIFYALQSLYVHHCNVHIEIQSDNISAIKYINDMGGMTSTSMDLLAKDIWQWCIERKINLSAIHVPGVLNTADFYSRNFSDATEWMLKADIFCRITSQFFVPKIDLFASRINKQIDRFVSWFPEPGSTYTNAFSICWKTEVPYIFPPFNLMGKVINKIKTDKVEKAIVVFPIWRSQTWFSMMMTILSDFPVRLPKHRDLLTLPHNGQEHPLAKKIIMGAAVLSGNHLRVKDFYQKLQTLSSSHGDLELGSNMTWRGNDGIFGVYEGKLIPLLRLKLK